MKVKTVLLALAFAVVPSVLPAAPQLKIFHLANEQNIVSVVEAPRYLLLPVQDDAPEAKLCVVENNRQATVVVNVRLARERVDYYVPFDLKAFAGRDVKIDVQGMPQGSLCWDKMSLSDTFDTTNTEKFRPVYHHTPAYGWMNDPNGMFYKDGVYHLYFQHNPYGSTWGNMNWGHSYSTDLVHWTYDGDAVTPDAWGTIFSGSAVVDKDNTAGFGRDAVVALYTSAKPTPWGDAQMQSLAYSTDGGKTFEKYAGNPVITSTDRDFRDPKVFWYAPGKHWVMALAVGQEMQLWSSADLKSWKHESNFGLKQGAHGGVWECPDLVELPVEGTDDKYWVLIININPGGPFGGSATQYFVGTFDGKKFTNQFPTKTKWMDYGKDHYATVTFSNALQQRARRPLRGSRLDEQLAVCRRSADEAVSLGKHHCPRPHPLPPRRRPAAQECSFKRDREGPQHEEERAAVQRQRLLRDCKSARRQRRSLRDRDGNQEQRRREDSFHPAERQGRERHDVL